MTALPAGVLRNGRITCAASGMETARAGRLGADSPDRLAIAEREYTG